MVYFNINSYTLDLSLVTRWRWSVQAKSLSMLLGSNTLEMEKVTRWHWSVQAIYMYVLLGSNTLDLTKVTSGTYCCLSK